MQSGKPVKRLAVIAHSHEEVVKDAVSRLERLAGSMDIELTDAENGPDLAVTLGGTARCCGRSTASSTRGCP